MALSVPFNVCDSAACRWQRYNGVAIQSHCRGKLSDALPDSLRASRDDGNFVVEIHIYTPLIILFRGKSALRNEYLLESVQVVLFRIGAKIVFFRKLSAQPAPIILVFCNALSRFSARILHPRQHSPSVGVPCKKSWIDTEKWLNQLIFQKEICCISLCVNMIRYMVFYAAKDMYYLIYLTCMSETQWNIRTPTKLSKVEIYKCIIGECFFVFLCTNIGLYDFS